MARIANEIFPGSARSVEISFWRGWTITTPYQTHGFFELDLTRYFNNT